MVNTVSSVSRVGTAATVPTVKAASAEPTGGSFSIASLGDTLSLGSSVAHVYNGVKTAVDGGRAIEGEVGTVWKNIKGLKPLSGSMKSAVGSIAQASLKMGQRSALFSGAISLVSNGYRFYKHQIDMPTFGSRVVGDTAGGFAGGVGATIAGGIGMAILGGPIGLAGTALTIGGALAGMAGYVFAENWFRKTKLFQGVVKTTRQMMGG